MILAHVLEVWSLNNILYGSVGFTNLSHLGRCLAQVPKIAGSIPVASESQVLHDSHLSILNQKTLLNSHSIAFHRKASLGARLQGRHPPCPHLLSQPEDSRRWAATLAALVQQNDTTSVSGTGTFSVSGHAPRLLVARS